MLQLTRIPALGPKRALLLHRELNVGSPDELRDAIKAGRLAGLKGFGSESEEKLLRGIEVLDASGGRVLLNVADEAAARVVEVISAVPGCQRCAPAGSLRRFAETVGDVDVLAAADSSGPLMTAHTDLTDGVATLADMVAKARARGYAYYRGHRSRAEPGHAAGGRREDAGPARPAAPPRRLSSPAGPGGEPMVLLHGTELNIAPDGTVDWPAEFLDGFDVCVASVHSNFDQSRPAMTRRFVAACENPYVNIIGHPLTRRIGRRPPVDVDLPELFRACARTGTALEVNAHPNRLDLPSAHIRAAKDAGVRFAIDSDAHFTGGLDYLRYGVGTAQRGWLTPDDVINTWPLPRLRAFLRKGR